MHISFCFKQSSRKLAISLNTQHFNYHQKSVFELIGFKNLKKKAYNFIHYLLLNFHKNDPLKMRK